MNSIIARSTLISFFLSLAIVTQGHTEDYYIYQIAKGELVISNKQLPPGSTIIKQLPGESAPVEEPAKPQPNVEAKSSPEPSKDK